MRQKEWQYCSALSQHPSTEVLVSTSRVTYTLAQDLDSSLERAALRERTRSYARHMHAASRSALMRLLYAD